MVLTEKTLDDILNYLDNSITKLAKDTLSTPRKKQQYSSFRIWNEKQNNSKKANVA
jgi:hypothetical protein